MALSAAATATTGYLKRHNNGASFKLENLLSLLSGKCKHFSARDLVLQAFVLADQNSGGDKDVYQNNY
jgi:hypothetical protein